MSQHIVILSNGQQRSDFQAWIAGVYSNFDQAQDHVDKINTEIRVAQRSDYPETPQSLVSILPKGLPNVRCRSLDYKIEVGDPLWNYEAFVLSVENVK